VKVSNPHDDQSSDHTRYAPKNFRERPQFAPEQPYVTSAPMVPTTPFRDDSRQLKPESALWPERVPDPPLRLQEREPTLINRILLLVAFAAAIALLIIFAKPMWQGARGLFDGASGTPEAKSSYRDTETSSDSKRLAAARTDQSAATGNSQPAANPSVQQNATGDRSAASAKMAAGAAIVPAASPPVQASVPPASAAPGDATSGPKSLGRGVTESEIIFGISAPFSGSAKELGQNMRLGIEAAFNAINASGGVYGRRLRLVAADDGYEPTRTAAAMKQLFEKDQIFGIIGNVGTPTAQVALPYALERKMLFFGAFTGAGLLRSDPPDRYVFNYRASYAEETDAVVQYLVKVKHLKPSQIAVFAQQDAYGDAGFSGVARAVRALGGNDGAILRLNYQRNTIDVDDAVEQLRKSRIPIRAVIMVPTYRAAAKFIEKTRDAFPDMIYTSVSFVGSTALANELMLLGKRFAAGVIVTQVVPAVDGHSSLVLDYKTALAKYFPGETPDYVSLEGYVAANVLISALKRAGPELDTEKLVQTLENLQNLDIGLGTPVNFGRSEHQAIHKVWGTQLNETGRYQAIELQ
jgi:branched-chain amino acid transport system substrate-binding protein